MRLEIDQLKKWIESEKSKTSNLGISAKYRPAVEADDEEIINPVLREHIGIEEEYEI